MCVRIESDAFPCVGAILVGRHTGAVLGENFWGLGPWKVSTVGKRTKSAANYGTVMSVQGHHCLLIELKLCDVIICIGGKTREGVVGLGENCARAACLEAHLTP